MNPVIPTKHCVPMIVTQTLKFLFAVKIVVVIPHTFDQPGLRSYIMYAHVLPAHLASDQLVLGEGYTAAPEKRGFQPIKKFASENC